MSSFDFRFGFGGCKSSGIGRELGPHAVREFVNEKTYYVK
jgi:acyl-CoA reductase-like NAD-dependent aldehyde dehydrogenase